MRFPKIEKLFKRTLVRLLGWLLPNESLRPEQLDLDTVKSILVVRQHDQLGDLLLSTPALRALRSRFPKARITAIARVYTHAVLLENPDIDRVLVYPEKPRLATPRRLWALARGLAGHYDLAVVLNTVSHSLSSDVLAWLSGARWRLGSAEHPFAGARTNLFYNVVSPPPSPRAHETRRSLAIVEHIGARAGDLGERLVLARAEAERGEEALWKHHLRPEKTVGIHLGAYKPENRWPHRLYAALADWLAEELGFQVAVFWGPREERLGESFLAKVRSKAVPFSGLGLREFAAAVRPLRLFVCNDTGVMHVAAALGTPTFAIFGKSEPEFWRPLNRNFYGVWGPDKTRASAELGTVKTGIKRLLEKVERP